MFDLVALLLIKLCGLAHTQPRGTTGRHTGSDLRLWWQASRDIAGHCSSLKGEGSWVTCGLLLFAELGNEASEQGSRPGVASSFDFLIELCAITRPLLPAFEQVGFVGIKQAPSIGRATPFGKRLSSDEPTDGLPPDFQSSRDLTQTHALLVECADGFVVAIAVGTACLGVRFGSSGGRRSSPS